MNLKELKTERESLLEKKRQLNKELLENEKETGKMTLDIFNKIKDKRYKIDYGYSVEYLKPYYFDGVNFIYKVCSIEDTYYSSFPQIWFDEESRQFIFGEEREISIEEYEREVNKLIELVREVYL